MKRNYLIIMQFVIIKIYGFQLFILKGPVRLNALPCGGVVYIYAARHRRRRSQPPLPPPLPRHPPPSTPPDTNTPTTVHCYIYTKYWRFSPMHGGSLYARRIISEYFNILTDVWDKNNYVN